MNKARLTLFLAVSLAFTAAAGIAQRQSMDDEEEQAKRLVVMIDGTFGDESSIGAGIIFDKRPDSLYIVTAKHVVRRGPTAARDIRVGLVMVPGERLPATLLDNFTGQDLAVLRVDGIARYERDLSSLRFDRLGDVASVKRADEVYTIGQPGGQRWDVSLGSDRIDRIRALDIVFQSARVAPGSSGGALLNSQRLLIGVVLKDSPPNAEAIRIDSVLTELTAANYSVAWKRPPGDSPTVSVRPAAPAPVSSAAAPATREAASPAKPGSLPRPGAGGSVTVNGVPFRMISLPGGDFRMGCSSGDDQCDDDEKPVRRVSVEAFQMSATEVTQDVWQAVTGKNPSDFKGAGLPVEHISWQDSQDFLETLTQRHDGFSYRLPTEAEWEYAARAGDSIRPALTTIAWFGLAESSGRASRPQTVATKAANVWGLYDMLGNVAEWCEDWYSPNYQRVVRGGSWMDGARSLRVSARGKAMPGTRDYSIGVRIVREPNGSPATGR